MFQLASALEIIPLACLNKSIRVNLSNLFNSTVCHVCSVVGYNQYLKTENHRLRFLRES